MSCDPCLVCVPPVSSILKAGGAPEQLAVLLEGESLFNDASGLVLFDIFIKKLAEVRGGLEGKGQGEGDYK